MSNGRPRPICWLITALWIHAAQLAAWGQTPAEPVAGTAGQDEIVQRLSRLPSNTVLAMVARPSTILASPTISRVPIEVSLEGFRQQTGMDLSQVEWLLAFGERPVDGPLSFGMVVRFVGQFDWRKLPQSTLRDTQLGLLDGRPYRQGRNPRSISICLWDEHTLILAPDATVRRVMGPMPASRPESAAVTIVRSRLPQQLDLHAVVDLERLRDLMPALCGAMAPATISTAEIGQLVEDLSVVELRIRLSRELVMGMNLYGRDVEAAARLERLCAEWAAAPGAADVASGPTAAAGLTPASAYARRVLWQMLQRTPPRRRDEQVQLGFRGEVTDQVAAMASLAMLLPNSERSGGITGHLETCDALQRLASAMRAFAAEHQQMPTTLSSDASGRPLLSWRVRLLPYLGHSSLYEQFRLDEAWDSPHNQALVAQMPEVFQHPDRAADGRTTYLVPVLDPAPQHPLDFSTTAAAVGDSPRKLLLIDASTSQAVVWTQPVDLEINMQQVGESLGDKAKSGFVGARADGIVEFFPPSLSPAELQRLFTGDPNHAPSP